MKTLLDILFTGEGFLVAILGVLLALLGITKRSKQKTEKKLEEKKAEISRLEDENKTSQAISKVKDELATEKKKSDEQKTEHQQEVKESEDQAHELSQEVKEMAKKQSSRSRSRAASSKLQDN